MTKFKILAKHVEEPENRNQDWRELTIEEGHSAKAAMRTAYLKNTDAKILALVAVPLRSWKPEQVRTENVVRLHFGETDV